VKVRGGAGVVESLTKIYLYALTFLSLLMLAWHLASRLVFHRRALSKRAFLQELVQLLTGAIFLPLYLSGIIGAWAALTASWLMLLAGFYVVTYVTRARPSLTDKQA
jgi:hypothetical protein